MIIDQAHRSKAVDDFSTSFSVEASAGTGKTTLLSTRFARLIEQKRGSLSSIVAITFTEKAAFELKERIALRLKESSAHHPHDLKEAYVSTIHAFCARILREKSLECGLDPEFSVMDPLTAQLFLKKHFYRWFSEISEASLKPLLRAADAGIRIERMFSLGSELYAHRDLLEGLSTTIEEPDVLNWVTNAAEIVRTLWDRAQNHCTNPHDRGFEAIESLARFFDQAVASPNLEKSFLHHLSITHAKGTQKDWDPPSVLKDQKEGLRTLSEEASALQSRLRAKIFSDLLHVLFDFVRSVEAEKDRRSWIDFDDLLFKTRDLLRNRADVQEALRAQFTHLLIDEYQDTDSIQAEIIWRLSSQGRMEDWRSAKLVPGKLFLVGDPKQSIYRFRKASIETYRQTTRTLMTQGERLVISQNFRSSSGVVDRVNDVFSKAFSEYDPLVSSMEHAMSERQPALVMLEPKETSLDAQSMRVQEAKTLARWVRALLDRKEPIVWDRSEKALRPAKAGDIALLFPTTTGLDLFEEAFREEGIPFTLEGGSAFFHRLEIHGFLSVLRAVLEPFDSVSVVAALKSGFFGVSDPALLARAQTQEGFDYRKGSIEGDDATLAHAMETLRTLHERFDLEAVSVMEAVLEETRAVPVSVLRFHGEQAAANLLKLVSMARHLSGSGIRTLRQFLHWVEETLKGKSQESEALLNEEDQEHVRFLTIHRSKGLEFPIVIMANLSEGQTRPETVLCDRQEGWIEVGLGGQEARFCTPGYELRLEEEKKAKEEEKSRLLYVGMTRAKDVLVLSKYVSNPARSPYWRWLSEGLASIPEVRSEAFREKTEDLTMKAAVDVDALAASWSKLRETLEMRRHQPAWQAFSEEEPMEGALQEKEALRMGIAFHRVMENLDRHHPDPKATLKEALPGLGLTHREETLLTWFDHLFSMPIWKEIQDATVVHREVPFSWREGKTMHEGTLDLIFQGPSGWKIVDFKTDRAREGESQKLEAYRRQLEAYRAASAHFLGEPIVECVLAFVQTRTEERF